MRIDAAPDAVAERDVVKAVETISETINETINETIKSHPGISRAELVAVLGKSRATVARAISALVDAGKIERRGSKKSGGYYAIDANIK